MRHASCRPPACAVLCALLLAAGTACSNAEARHTTPDGSAGNPPDAAAPDAPVGEDASEALRAAQPWIDAHCRVARTCCERAGFDLQPLAVCERAAIEQIPFLDAVAAGTAIVDPASVETCAAALDRLAGSCTYPTSTLGECSTLWAGTRGEGERCASVAECARASDPVVCLKIADAVVPRPETGTCVTMQRGALGDECVSSSYEGYYGTTYTAVIVQQAFVYCDAADGLYCDFGSYTCVPYATEGQTCGSVQCALGLYCDGVCQVRSSAGASCSSLDACALPLLCENGVCTEPPVASGALCSGDFG